MKITVEKQVGDIKITLSVEDEWEVAVSPNDVERYAWAMLSGLNPPNEEVNP